MHLSAPIRLCAFMLTSLLPGLGLSGVAVASDEVRWNAVLDLPSSEAQIELDAWTASSALASQMQPLGIAATLKGNSLELSGRQDLSQVRAALFTEVADYADLLGGPVELELSLPQTNGPVNLELEARPATGYAWYLIDAPLSRFAQEGESSFEAHANGYGTGATQVMQLKPTKKGDGKVRLVYRRAFATAEPIHAKINIAFPRTIEQIELTDPLPVQLDSPSLEPSASLDAALPANLALPASYDSRTRGIVPSIRDQGSCGSCWAFATVGVMEIATKLGGGPLTDLSEQFLVSCNLDGYGCGGGWFVNKYHHSTLAHNQTAVGAVLEAERPYTASNGACAASYSHPYRASQTKYVLSSYSIPSNDQIKSAILTYGAVAAAVCVDKGWYSYTGGIYRPTSNACNGSVNHGIGLIGWDDSSQTWLLRNSWSDAWGEKGYMRIAYDPNGSTSKVGYGANVIQFAESSYTLTVMSSGASKVTIGATPTDYAGATTYTKSGIASGTKITLTSPAKSGTASFSGWSGCDSTAGTSCTVAMTSTKTVTANYAPSYSLTVSAAGASAVMISASPAAYTGKTNYVKTGIASGTSVTLTAPAIAGTAIFKSWTGCTRTSGASCTVAVSADQRVTANYAPTYSLTVQSSGASAVAIGASPTAHTGTTHYTKTGIPSGTSIVLTAPTTAGKAVFKQWTGCTSTSGTTCTVTVKGNKTLTAHYVSPPTYTLTLKSAGASGIPLSASSAAYAGKTNYSKTGIIGGTSFTLTAPATAGASRFKSWTGCSSASGTSCMIAMTTNRTVTVTYTPTYSLNVNALGASAVELQASHATYAGRANYSKSGIHSGTSITLAAPATAGTSRFQRWTGCSRTSGTSCTVTMTASKTVTVTYAPTYSLTVNTAGASGVLLQASPAAYAGRASYIKTRIPSGTSITLNAPINAGAARFLGWTGCSSTAGRRCTVKLTGDTTLTARYASPSR